MTPGKGAVPVKEVLAFLAREYPGARVLLDHRNPFELLVATVLAAQCTDERVNAVTPPLFRAWPGPAPLSNASREEVEAAVRSTGFYRNKARAIRELSAVLLERHDGRVPRTMAELTALPGVGRKTASILLGACFGLPALPVDTHVGRVMMSARTNDLIIDIDFFDGSFTRQMALSGDGTWSSDSSCV